MGFHSGHSLTTQHGRSFLLICRRGPFVIACVRGGRDGGGISGPKARLPTVAELSDTVQAFGKHRKWLLRHGRRHRLASLPDQVAGGDHVLQASPEVGAGAVAGLADGVQGVPGGRADDRTIRSDVE